MTTSTKTDLLQSCVQDLHAARGCACDGLPQVAKAAGYKLRPALQAIAQTYDEERQAFEELSLIHISEPRDPKTSRMPSSA